MPHGARRSPISGALSLKQPTPMKLSKMHAYLVTAGLLRPSGDEQKQ
jgi:hypothetical protein